MIKRPLMTVAVLDCILSMKPSSSLMWVMREKKKKSLKIGTAPLADLQIHSYTLISRGKIPAQEKFSCPCLCWAYYPPPSFLSDPVLSLACPPTVTHTPKKKNDRKEMDEYSHCDYFWGGKIIGVSASSLWIAFVLSRSSSANVLASQNVAKGKKNNNQYRRECKFLLREN